MEKNIEYNNALSDVIKTYDYGDNYPSFYLLCIESYLGENSVFAVT